MFLREVFNKCQSTQNIIKDKQLHFGFMDVFLLHGAQQHVSATHVTIYSG